MAHSAHQSLVVTFLGPDRPGLVEKLSQLVADQGGNWLESRMAHLGGHFAGLARIEVASDKAKSLATALSGLGDLHVTVADESADTAKPAALVDLDLVGHDRPGIVSHITKIIAQHKINVEEFSSEIESAPMTGEPLFKAKALLGLPAGADLARFQADLESIAADLMVEARLQQA